MEQYYRMVIDSLKQGIVEMAATGKVDADRVGKDLLALEMELDRRVVGNQPHECIDGLIDDLRWLRNDVPESSAR
ncbi:MAG: hypothetical protein MJZ81_06085 [Bacteroidales bacterium]|nr:hypothetical protein [Bacteroidales bacterium]